VRRLDARDAAARVVTYARLASSKDVTIVAGAGAMTKSETKFTPGPWTVEDPMDFELAIVEANKPTYEWRFIATCSLPDGDDDQAFTGREIHANARLISAAPDLYASLLELLEPLERASAELVAHGKAADENAGAAFDRARSALAKARGTHD
jgi:hypothetical protein